MINSEIEVINIIKKDYLINEKEILCAAYLHNPLKSPEDYLIINSFIKKDFSNLTKKDITSFKQSSFSSLDEKDGFLSFLNHNIKISSKISIKYKNIRKEEYRNEEWSGSLFFIPKNDIIDKVAIELFYEKDINEKFNNPIINKGDVNFDIIDVGPMLSRNKEQLRLYLNNKYIVK